MDLKEYLEFIRFWVSTHDPKTITELISLIRTCPTPETIESTPLPF